VPGEHVADFGCAAARVTRCGEPFPLSHGHRRDDVIDEMGGGLRHVRPPDDLDLADVQAIWHEPWGDRRSELVAAGGRRPYPRNGRALINFLRNPDIPLASS